MAGRGEIPEDHANSSNGYNISSLDPNSSLSPPVDISSFTHTPNYCEENVYLLCKKLCMTGIADQKGTDLFVVFISNEEKKSRKNEQVGAHHMVWDLDSSLPCPLPLNEYFIKAIAAPFSLNPIYTRLFRVVHAPIFLQCFASDRSHMKDSLGNWLSPPPMYKPLVAEDGTKNNLDKYIRMHAADAVTSSEALISGVYANKFGVVISETMFENFFSQIQG